MSPKAQFELNPMPWIYTWWGALVFTAVIKLHPIHRRFRRLEKANVRHYFQKDTLRRLMAGAVCYFGSIRRVLHLDKKARQDYFALNRHGCFASQGLPDAMPSDGTPATAEPVVIVPGLNTPPVFFRQMQQYFTKRGYAVSVLTLPNKGLADVETAASALGHEVERLRKRFNAKRVNIVGHCLGGLIGQYYLSSLPKKAESPVKTMITLSTGFGGAKGVGYLKHLWLQNHPKADKAPSVFDELIEWNVNIAHRAGEVAYHNFMTVWDFIVELPQAFLRADAKVTNTIIDDADIDHLTIALNPKMFAKIEHALQVAH